MKAPNQWIGVCNCHWARQWFAGGELGTDEAIERDWKLRWASKIEAKARSRGGTSEELADVDPEFQGRRHLRSTRAAIATNISDTSGTSFPPFPRPYKQLYHHIWFRSHSFFAVSKSGRESANNASSGWLGYLRLSVSLYIEWKGRFEILTYFPRWHTAHDFCLMLEY